MPDEVVERGGAVLLGLALAEQVQVRAREQQDRRHWSYPSIPTAASALRTAAGSGLSTRSIPLGPASMNVSPPADFLSRAMIGTRSSARSPGGAWVGRPSPATRYSWCGHHVLVDPFQRSRELRGEDETDRHRFAVQQRVPRRGLERVRERVPVVEHGAGPGAFELVGARRTRALIAARARDHVGENGGIAREQRGRVRGDEVVTHQRVLRDLAETAAVLAIGQRRERARVGEHGERLMERADEVLAFGQVHAGLAADRGVDHRQQRGRHLHDVDTAVVDGGGEPGGVADDTAAERDHDVAAQEAPLREPAAEIVDRRERLVVFTFAHEERLVRDSGAVARGPDAVGEQRPGSRPG